LIDDKIFMVSAPRRALRHDPSRDTFLIMGAEGISCQSAVGGRSMARRETAILMVSCYLIGIVARALWVLATGIPEPDYDALEYLSLARSIAAGTGFTLDGVTPYLYRPPLFSAALALWFRVAGSGSVESAAIFLVILNAFSAPLAAMLARSFGGTRRAALVAGLFTAIYPFGFVNIALPLQEWLLAPLLSLAFIAGIRFVASPKPGTALPCGLILGLTSLAKAPHLLLPWCLAAAILAIPDGRNPGRWRAAGTLLIISHLVVLPWAARNYAVSGGRWIPINDQGTGVILWAACDGDCGTLRDAPDDPPAMPYARHGVGFFTRGETAGAMAVFEANEAALAEGCTGPALERARRDAAWRHLRANPGRYLRNLAKTGLLTLAPAARPGVFLSSYALRIPIMALIHIPLFLALVWSLVEGVRNRRADLLAVAAFTLACIALYVLTLTGEGRQMIAFLPMLVALATHAGERLASGRRKMD
jgi:hypothetical protein